MASYLESTYLGGDFDADAGGATSPLAPAFGEVQGNDLVALPGGIVMPRKTLWLLLAAIAAAAVIVYLRKRDRRLKRLERAAEDE